MGEPTPHDHLFRFVFSDPIQAASYLQDIVPAGLSELVDWSTLARKSGSFVDAPLQARHTDLVFTAQMGDSGEGIVYVLFEHQSTSDRWMAWRLLRYMVRIWDQWQSEHPEPRLLPLIIPIVLFQRNQQKQAEAET